MECGDRVRGSLRPVAGGVVLVVHAHPGARREGVWVEDDGVHVYVRAPARGGRANEAIVKLLRGLGLRGRIVEGLRGRVKEVLLEGVGVDDVVGVLCG